MANNKKILVIDDEPDLVKILKFRLEKKGYEVFIAQDGQSGLLSANKLNPDLIILDINMPNMGGLEFYKEISTKHGYAKFPVLVLTARGELNDLFKQIEADGFMSKPFEIDKLLSEVTRIIEKDNELAVYIMDFKDSPHVQKMQEALRKERYRVVVVENIEEFKNEAVKKLPDFILMEYIQAETSGEEIITKIKQMPSEFARNIWPASFKPPITVYTYSGLDYKEKSLKAGADKYIGRPLEYEEFVRAVEELRIARRL